MADPTLLDPAPTRVMGVLNVTPDSFSDGGRWAATETALARAAQLVADGAQIIDVGGESTRPGSVPVAPDEELSRVLPVVQALAGQDVAVSVDTLHAGTARAAVAAGAQIVNDVSGGLHDPLMLPTLAELTCAVILQHWRGTPQTMNSLAVYQDVVPEVMAELSARVDQATSAGIAPQRIIIDPGLGFAKNAEHNWAILAALDEFEALGHPVLIGASRKHFLGQLMPPGRQSDPLERDPATAAITTICAQHHIWAVRVHEAGPSADAVRVVEALRAVPGHPAGGESR